MPERIQRKRSKGWRMPENTVYVGRPTKWGNSYKIESEEERAEAVESFEIQIKMMITRRGLDLSPLRGKDLACWCLLDKPCHADVLLRLANTACSGLALPSAKLSGLAQVAKASNANR